MTISRRDFVLLGLGAMLAGCASDKSASELPSPVWPGASGHAYGGPAPRYYGSTVTPYPPLPAPTSYPAASARPPLEAEPAPAVVIPGGTIQAIPRSRWAEGAPIMSRINPMNGVNRITIHHEGWKVVTFADAVSTAQRLEEIRESHTGAQLHAGDIAYHFVIDRAGRVWQGRDIRYQGAHVSGENEHNVGVMVLGNFDLQSPTDAQLTTLRRTVNQLMRQYRVANSRVYTHRELRPTECPGTALQPRVVVMRNHAFA